MPLGSIFRAALITSCFVNASKRGLGIVTCPPQGKQIYVHFFLYFFFFFLSNNTYSDSGIHGSVIPQERAGLSEGGEHLWLQCSPATTVRQIGRASCRERV